VLRIRSEKDFLAGALYVLLGLGFLWFGQDYKMGVAARMGPGYFPLTLACVLVVFGAISLIRSFMTDGPEVDSPIAGYVVMLLPGIMVLVGGRFDRHPIPTGLGWVLLLLGLAGIAWSVRKAEPGAVLKAIRPTVMVTLGCIVFGLLLPRGGLVFALPGLVILSAMASAKSEYDLKGLLVLVGLVLFCVLAFVKGLGVPMPIFGSWFDGLVPAWLQR